MAVLGTSVLGKLDSIMRERVTQARLGLGELFPLDGCYLGPNSMLIHQPSDFSLSARPSDHGEQSKRQAAASCAQETKTVN